MQSSIYTGRVTHRRCDPVKHQFTYRLCMVYLDLAELVGLLAHHGGMQARARTAALRNSPRISQRRYAPVSFDRASHLRDWEGPLHEAACDCVEHQTGVRPRGPIRLLTQLRYFGYYFSPLNLYYCFDQEGHAVETIIAEVNNTPWGEQHCYVLWEGNRATHDAGLSFSHPKQFHVSPFMDMDVDYQWQLTQPAATLGVQLENVRGGVPFFQAAMSLARQPLTRRSLAGLLARYPLITARITSAIYWQALKLWWKKCPSFSHPNRQPTSINR